MNRVTLTAILLTATSALGAGYQFPSAASSDSSDGKWKLICESPLNGDDAGHHLLLVRKVDGKRFEVRRFDRHCNTLWSSDSSHIAVTDWMASDMSDVFICSVATPESSRSVRKLFTGVIQEKELRGHCYFEAIKWVGGHHLRIKVFGHTDESPAYNFEYLYLFDLATGRLERKIKKPNKMVQGSGAIHFARNENRTSSGGWLPSLTFPLDHSTSP